MLKATAAGRETVPDNVLRYKRMWQLLIDAVDAGCVGDVDSCEVCGQDDGKAIRCPLCLVVFHPECCGLLSRHLDLDTGRGRSSSSSSSSPACTRERELHALRRLGAGVCPDALRSCSSLCSLCHRVV
eukprot:11193502-Lingulodinium_polyedra.AAC.1